jgi:tRNA G10  N-methylase Trm11
MERFYFFILGNNPCLSVAEIESVLGKNIIKRYFSDNFYLVKTASEINPMELQKRMGGVIKIGMIFEKTDPSSLNKSITGYLLKKAGKNKLKFAINSYGAGFNKNDGLAIKKNLKENKISSRLVESKEAILSSVVSKKQILDKGGIEVNCFKMNDDIYLGQTLSCQPFEELSWRDWQRPQKDNLSGMLPPKIAQIMINLARAKKNDILLDPFVGSGTILMEAGLMGYKNLIGSDISKKAIVDTQENIQWLVSQNLLGKSQAKSIDLLELDVIDLPKQIARHSIDAIITEPYLGPAQRKSASHDIGLIKKELEKTYLSAFESFRAVLKDGGRVIIIFPVFIKKDNIYLEIIEKIKKSGFRILNPIINTDINCPAMSGRGGIIYSRPGQKVGREIFIFQK